MTRNAEQILKKVPGIEDVLTIGGFSFLTSATESNVASMVIKLKPWDQRTGNGLDVVSLMARCQQALNVLPQARVTPFVPPQIPGLGVSGGFQIEIRRSRGYNGPKFAQAAQAFANTANQDKSLANVFNSFSTDIPQLKVTVDRERAKVIGVPIDSIYTRLQTFLGGLIINDFNRFGRVYKVMLQAEPQYRATPQDLAGLYVRSASGQMVPFTTLVTVGQTTGPDIIQRYNLYQSAEVTGSAANGVSSGQALNAMKDLAAKHLPSGMGYDWSGTAYEEEQSSGQQGPIFGLALAFVFLVLAAMYESWAVPLV